MDAIVKHSREMTEKGSKSFAAAARLLPQSVRDQAYMLYAWCRHCDDVIDGQELGFAAPAPAEEPPAERLAALTRETERAIRGDAEKPVFIALQRVLTANDIPARRPLELLRGFEMDVAGRRYRTVEDTLSYSYHVAGVVGVMMAMIMGARDRDTLNRASDLGIAFQLTNICRDVMDDAAVGRVYLPEDWLSAAGAPPHDIAAPRHRAAVAEVAARLLQTAEGYYASAKVGLTRLNFRPALAIAAARGVYREIGVAVKSRGADAWDTRTIISKGRKKALVASAFFTALEAHSLGRLRRAAPRDGLWTHPGLDQELFA
ncbi:MAG: phytoene/squalene synthase family protein [Hyphomicrobiales bacterium]|nr:phytoene/squalene synthase family protein [Hyphomicrobiales bacterium]